MKDLKYLYLILIITSSCLTSLVCAIGLDDSARSFVDFRIAIRADSPDLLTLAIQAAGNIEDSRWGIAGITPLHEAALEGKVWAIDHLLDAGVNVDVASDAGKTPLETAIRHHKTAAALRLIELGANRTNMLALTDDPLIRTALES